MHPASWEVLQQGEGAGDLQGQSAWWPQGPPGARAAGRMQRGNLFFPWGMVVVVPLCLFLTAGQILAGWSQAVDFKW